MPVFKAVIALVCCIVSLIVPAREQIQQCVRKQAVQINSIQSEGQDYADLEAIGNAIGYAIIVMLGEQDHGDAPAFLAKARLIKYLHEQKGFNVLAFENDFFSTNYEWELVKSGASLFNSSWELASIHSGPTAQSQQFFPGVGIILARARRRKGKAVDFLFLRVSLRLMDHRSSIVQVPEIPPASG